MINIALTNEQFEKVKNEIVDKLLENYGLRVSIEKDVINIVHRKMSQDGDIEKIKRELQKNISDEILGGKSIAEMEQRAVNRIQTVLTKEISRKLQNGITVSFSEVSI